MHQRTKENLPKVAADLVANRPLAAIGRDLGLTGSAVAIWPRRTCPTCTMRGGLRDAHRLRIRP
jgi:hypothetical protein